MSSNGTRPGASDFRGAGASTRWPDRPPHGIEAMDRTGAGRPSFRDDLVRQLKRWRKYIVVCFLAAVVLHFALPAFEPMSLGMRFAVGVGVFVAVSLVRFAASAVPDSAPRAEDWRLKSWAAGVLGELLKLALWLLLLWMADLPVWVLGAGCVGMWLVLALASAAEATPGDG